MIIVNEIKCSLDDDLDSIKRKLIKKCKLKPNDLISFEIYKRSLDARDEIIYVYSLLVEAKNENRLLKLPFVTKYTKTNLKAIKLNSDIRPIIVGYGPAGLFAAYRMVEAGLKPIIFERGKRIKDRVNDVELFFKEGLLNPDSNVQFGEGGAGTFSDAKLTTRIKNPFIDYILDVFIKYGADPKIKIDAHAHIGTDKIRAIIERISDDLMTKGASFHFKERVIDFIIENQKIKGIKTAKNTYYSDYVLLAFGHSAYDTISTLNKYKVDMEVKDIAIGFRVEHPQDFIDKIQYKGLKHPKLKASEYFLRYKALNGRGVYSFCMCPGGLIVPSSSDLKTIVTNGMSYSKRNSGYANSAILCQVYKSDFANDNILAGFDYLKYFEKEAYKKSLSYMALSQNLKDYLNNDLNPLIRESTYSLKTILYNFNHFFPKEINETMHEAFKYFDTKMPGFIDKGILIGPETRSSCPIRIKRKENLESTNIIGLYPIGEGAGWGGGIMSCALDGIRVTDQILIKIKDSSL